MQKGKVLCLDYGKKRIGLASGNLEDKIAFPRGVIFNKDKQKSITEIAKICAELSVVLIVVGLPLNMEGEVSKNKMVPLVQNFVNELTKRIDNVKVAFFDERLSSFESEKIMKEIAEKFGKTRMPNDAYAAQIILQRFFDKFND